MEARTMKLESRYFWIVLTFVGDSTTTSDFLATRYPFMQIYSALASPLINSALASGLCPSARTINSALASGLCPSARTATPAARQQLRDDRGADRGMSGPA